MLILAVCSSISCRTSAEQWTGLGNASGSASRSHSQILALYNKSYLSTVAASFGYEENASALDKLRSSCLLNKRALTQAKSAISSAASSSSTFSLYLYALVHFNHSMEHRF